MRDIKFRSWIITDSGHGFISDSGHGFISDSEYTLLVLTTLIEKGTAIMQYTGLHDKNGVEIYEGDIVNVRMANDHLRTGKIVWRNNLAMFMVAIDYKGDDGVLYFELSSYRIESLLVIGNIYENPELLK